MAPHLKAIILVPHNVAAILTRHTLRNNMADRRLSSDYVIEGATKGQSIRPQ
jgi:hypothetical protein